MQQHNEKETSMTSRDYLGQLISRVFGDLADTWLDTPNPNFLGKPRPRDLVDCSDCSGQVEDYLLTLSTDAAVQRARAHLPTLKWPTSSQTLKTWMSSDQFADVLELYAACREYYVAPHNREPGNFHSAPASDQWLMCEVDAYLSAARILRHLDETPIGCHTAMTGIWERGIEAILHGDKPALGLTGGA